MPRNFYLPPSIFCLTVFYREERSQGENPLRLSFAICSPAALIAMKAGDNFPFKAGDLNACRGLSGDTFACRTWD
jgi:hypothetical protein